MSEKIVEDICNLPVSLKKLNKSIVDLIKDTGYFNNQKLVTDSFIKDYLNNHQEVISKWLTYSSDKRASSGWYIIESENHEKYIVGYLNKRNNKS